MAKLGLIGPGLGLAFRAASITFLQLHKLEKQDNKLAIVTIIN